MELYKLSVINDVYADAFLTDESGHLLFMSLWGRDTALQEFIARLSLATTENGIRNFNVYGDDGVKHFVQIPGTDYLSKTTDKTSKDTVLGQLNHLWIYDRLAECPDFTNQRALMLSECEKTPDPWPLVKTICQIPLLDPWRETVLACFTGRKWIQPLERGRGIRGLFIDLGHDEVEAEISSMVRSREVTI
jgi:hypothetical protein